MSGTIRTPESKAGRDEQQTHVVIGFKSFEDEQNNGARGRDRTTDTAIFNRMLYQLSYPGAEAASVKPLGA